MTYVLLAVMLAIPPILAALIGAQIKTIYVVAAVMAVLGLFIGGSAFIIVGLIGVVVGLAVALRIRAVS